MKKAFVFIVGLVIFFGAVSAFGAPADEEILYKKTTTLTPGTYNLRFSLWDAATAGVMIWSEEKKITLTSSAIKTILGDTGPLDGVDFSQQLWIQVDRVKTGPVYKVVGTREKLLSVPSALGNPSPDGARGTAWGHYIITDNTSQVAVQDSITIPDPGIVVAIATGYVFHDHVNGTTDNTIITLDNVSGTNTVNVIGTVEVRTPAQVPTGAYWAVPYSITRTFVETTEGAKTYYVNCMKSQGGSGYCYGNHLTLLYFKKAF